MEYFIGKKSDFSHFQKESSSLVADSMDSPHYIGTPTNTTRLVVVRIQQFAFSKVSQLCPHSFLAVLFTEIPLFRPSTAIHNFRPEFVRQPFVSRNSFPHKRENAFPFRNRKIFVESSYRRTSGKIFANTISSSPRKSFSLRLFHRQ